MPAAASLTLAALAGLCLAAGPAAGDDSPLGLHLEATSDLVAPRSPATPSSAALLVLNSLSEARRASLGQALHDLVASMGRRKNPLFVPLDEGEEHQAIENLIAQTAPAFTAARALLAGEWPSPEGDVRVRPVARCAAQRLCVTLRDGPKDGAEESRARFLAWPLGYAIIISVGEDAKLHAVAEALRAPGSRTIALVLTGADFRNLRQSPALPSLQREARQVLSVLSAKRTPLLDNLAGLARARSGKNTMPWLPWPPRAILIVPRLGALATAEQFVEDVRARLREASAEVEWLASPR